MLTFPFVAESTINWIRFNALCSRREIHHFYMKFPYSGGLRNRIVWVARICELYFKSLFFYFYPTLFLYQQSHKRTNKLHLNMRYHPVYWQPIYMSFWVVFTCFYDTTQMSYNRQGGARGSFVYTLHPLRTFRSVRRSLICCKGCNVDRAGSSTIRNVCFCKPRKSDRNII